MNTSNNLIYLNAIGALFKEQIVINNDDNRNINIDIKEIKKVILKKRKRIRWKIILLIVTFFVILSFLILENYLDLDNNVFVASFVILSFITYFFISEINYKLVLYSTNEPIEINIHKNHKDQAKILMFKINRTIKESKRQ